MKLNTCSNHFFTKDKEITWYMYLRKTVFIISKGFHFKQKKCEESVYLQQNE